MRQLSLVFAAVSQFAGCSKSPSATEKPSGPHAQLATSMFLAAAPADSKEVGVAKRDAAEGRTVLLHGRIGGRKDPFVSGRAIFTLADMSLPLCSDNPEDGCETPWDYCCEPLDKITSNTVTIRVLDAKGQVVPGDLNGVSGIRPSAEVFVQGRVSQKNGDKNLVVDATAFYIKPG
jgi:hypothetical protein